mmetsp:Transcript_5542/g.9409  ORF Transcript_5542/g.9409 Transcript_5542/m.9409 type:complete len:217 (-) Transcript_5542:780-1430(-)
MLGIFIDLSQLRIFHVIAKLLFHFVALQNKLLLGADGTPSEGERNIRQIGIPIKFSHERTNGTGQATGVGIVATHGTLEEGRIDNPSAEKSCLLIGARISIDLYLHYVTRALTIANQITGKARHYFQKSLIEFCLNGILIVSWDLIGRHKDGGVAGALVAIDTDRVEAVVHGARQHLLKTGLFNGGIRHEVAKHCGHVGLDHTSSLGDADQTGTVR